MGGEGGAVVVGLGVGGVAECVACAGGDAVDVGLFGGCGWECGGGAEGVCGAEEVGGVGVVAGEGECAGESFEGEDFFAGCVEAFGEGECVEVVGACGGGVAAEFGEVAEFGVDHGEVGCGGVVAGGGVEDGAEVGFGGVEVAGFACGEAEAHFGEDAQGVVAVAGGEGGGLVAQVGGGGVVGLLHGDPAEPGEFAGDVGP